MSAHIVEITNAFEPQKDQIKHIVNSGISINQWLQIRFPDFVEFDQPTVCTVNGKALLREDWDYEIKDGDVINFTKVAPGDPITATIIAVSVLAAAYAIYKLANMPDPSAGETPSSDPVYSLSGQSNDTKLMEPIEVSYGCVRMWPSYAAVSYNKFENDDQLVYSLFCLGQGYYDIDTIQIEDTDASSFDGVETEITDPYELVTLFPDNIVTSVEIASIELEKESSSEIDVSGPFTLNPANTLCNRIEIDIVLPSGLYYSNDDGGIDARTVSAKFQYREIDSVGDPVGDGDWLTLVNFSKTLATVNTKRFTIGVDVPEGRYEVQGWRTNYTESSSRLIDTIQWSTARAFLPSTESFGSVSMLAFTATATNSVNDSASNRVNVIATRKLPTWHPDTGWSDPVATRSIVWAFCDLLMSDYGGRLDDQYLDLETLYEMDLEYEARGEYFDWIFDQKETVWEAATTIARCGRAMPVLKGSQVTMIRDEAKTFPVAVFNQENIIKDSFKWDINLFQDSDYDSIEIEYTDPDTWNSEVILCALDESDGTNPEQITFAGCTSRDHAYREGLYIAANRYYVRENISFQTGLEGHIPSYGDLITVSHDLPRWGQSGYVVSIFGKQVGLSDPVDFGDGNNYIVFRKKDGSAAGPYQVIDSGSSTVVELVNEIEDEFYFDNIHEPPFYQFGVADNWAKLCRVVDVTPSDSETIDIVCTNYDDRLYAFEDYTAPEVETDDVNIPTIPDLPEVTGLSAYFESTNYLRISWDAALGAQYYILQASSNGGEDWDLIEEPTSVNYLYYTQISDVSLRVCAVNVGSGAWNYYDVSNSTDEETTA